MSEAAETAASARAQDRSVRVIALATGITNMSVMLWFPFLPLLMLQIGAVDEADAVFWVAIAQTVQGGARLIGGPFWGVVADRYGRKQMFVRTLYCAALTTFIVSAIGAPWQLCIALAVQGLLSGFVPASMALTSVTVPDGKLKGALSLVTGSQYLGSAIGPMVGAALALAFGYQGAILWSAIAIVAVATVVVYAVPADRVAHKQVGQGGQNGPRQAPLAPFRPTFQLLLATFIYFMLFGLNTFRSVATPIALQGIVGEDVTHMTGLAFAFGGAASAAGIWLLAGQLFKKQRLRTMLTATAVLLAITHLFLARSDTAMEFILWFTVISLLNAGMAPVTNTLIALNVSRARRGTAFGLASGAQAVAFMAGPLGAAAFASTSLKTGFAALGLLMAALALFMYLVLREPQGEPE
jgi:DHA1 family multidrug resistance protein-like MFS transporter